MDDGIQLNRNGCGFFGLLTIVFIALKLTGHIGWPWWIVLAPMWGPLALVLAIAAVAAAILAASILIYRILR